MKVQSLNAVRKTARREGFDDDDVNDLLTNGKEIVMSDGYHFIRKNDGIHLIGKKPIIFLTKPKAEEGRLSHCPFAGLL